ncbi:torsin-1A-like [Phymastichus coffea]|uniref:torsin-1A-like n=1 Tax=Phymastichus coffea TaxID=108790 RepID=UPI00273CE98C|nr:torsin-1A-like [Phymastichus coffea]
MKIHYLFVFFFVLLTLVHFGALFLLESITVGTVAAIGYAVHCKFMECCSDEYILHDMKLLKDEMKHSLYGQQIAQNIVLSAIQSHVNHPNPRKPLALSFHGLPGTGKTYVVSMIAKSLFKLGVKSKHYYFFNGRNDFPSDLKTDLYQMILIDKIERALNSCEQSLFVFDEVDKMPSGVLDALVPFLDYTSYGDNKNRKAIFIFLSNTGSTEIVDRMIKLWQEGKNRDDISIQDFEPLIEIGAFNEKGGFHKSGTIESKLIDHHVPFLPMEEKHVIMCIKDVFRHWGDHNPNNNLIKEVLTHVTYGPPPYNIYSTGGCKRLDYKVSSVLFKDDFN